MPRQSESEVSGIARAAMDYRAAGWSVVPLRPRDKRPLIGWERFQHELASSATVTKRYRRWPDADIGVMTGEISNLVVLDVDPNHGGDASLDRLERQLAPLPVTCRQRPAAAAGTFISPTPALSYAIVPDWRKASMCVGTAATSSPLPLCIRAEDATLGCLAARRPR